jgi:hypothetical protein
VIATADSRPRKDDKLDPKAELAAQFKEARAMLDEVGLGPSDDAGAGPSGEDLESSR